MRRQRDQHQQSRFLKTQTNSEAAARPREPFHTQETCCSPFKLSELSGSDAAKNHRARLPDGLSKQPLPHARGAAASSSAITPGPVPAQAASLLPPAPECRPSGSATVMTQRTQGSPTTEKQTTEPRKAGTVASPPRTVLAPQVGSLSGYCRGFQGEQTSIAPHPEPGFCPYGSSR